MTGRLLAGAALRRFLEGRSGGLSLAARSFLSSFNTHSGSDHSRRNWVFRSGSLSAAKCLLLRIGGYLRRRPPLSVGSLRYACNRSVISLKVKPLNNSGTMRCGNSLAFPIFTEMSGCLRLHSSGVLSEHRTPCARSAAARLGLSRKGPRCWTRCCDDIPPHSPNREQRGCPQLVYLY